MSDYLSELHSATLLFWAIKMLVNLLFAGAVAKDAGLVMKNRGKTELVSGLTWAFGTLVIGVWVAAIYWFMHHLKFSRPD